LGYHVVHSSNTAESSTGEAEDCVIVPEPVRLKKKSVVNHVSDIAPAIQQIEWQKALAYEKKGHGHHAGLCAFLGANILDALVSVFFGVILSGFVGGIGGILAGLVFAILYTIFIYSIITSIGIGYTCAGYVLISRESGRPRGAIYIFIRNIIYVCLVTVSVTLVFWLDLLFMCTEEDIIVDKLLGNSLVEMKDKSM
jgi:hypothetical protein